MPTRWPRWWPQAPSPTVRTVNGRTRTGGAAFDVSGVTRTQLRSFASPLMIACHQRPVPDGLVNDQTSNSLNSRMACFAPTGADISQITLGYCGFGFNMAELDMPIGSYTVRAAIELPRRHVQGGLFWRLA